MKKTIIFAVGLAAFVLGAVLGYGLGERRGHNNAITEEWMDSMERAELNGEYEARAYFRCLQDIDSGNISNLHRFAMGHLRYYVSDVQEARQQGCAWVPHIRSLYSNATVYLTEHPRKE